MRKYASFESTCDLAAHTNLNRILKTAKSPAVLWGPNTAKKPVFVCRGCYNRNIDWVPYKQHIDFAQFWSLGNPKSRCQQIWCLVNAHFLVQRGLDFFVCFFSSFFFFSVQSYMAEGSKDFSGVSFIRVLTHLPTFLLQYGHPLGDKVLTNQFRRTVLICSSAPGIRAFFRTKPKRLLSSFLGDCYFQILWL